MDQSIIEIDHVFMLLAPEAATKQELEVLSLLSALMIENEKNMRLFESQDESAIRTFIAGRFEQLFNKKTLEMRNE